eukprot:CAMPEP_0113889156 /NCGR_PEP_ID=MMETSP0780_2-20120614/13316_1 /TAXON_ID=652834 /ORGANISM="Palpitomonas bilix" /LENGTH=222 /DNA_ID=CAMNT_0000878175 /DNA_START=101 /DNA_END=769 /DNA_ORIENTATION=+ /assembly_acc=CAM_ASM_000599
MMLAALKWMNPPASVEGVDKGSIAVTTLPKSDFWVRTHYHFTHDNGHFGYNEVEGDFDMEVAFTAQYEKLYDQAGLMVWRGGDDWVKTGIEYVHGEMNISAVVTRGGFSDWSRIPMPHLPPTQRVAVRLEMRGLSFNIGYKLVGGEGVAGQGEKEANEQTKWITFRTSSLASSHDEHEAKSKKDGKWQAGVMAASPTAESLKVVFSDFSLATGQACSSVLEA